MSGRCRRESRGRTASACEVDLALRVVVAKPCAEAVGAVLMDLLGPFQEEAAGESSGGDVVALLFYPEILEAPSDEAVLAALPAELLTAGHVRLEWGAVPRDWVVGWKDHFRPTSIGVVRIRPPWEPAPSTTAPGSAGPGGAAPAGSAEAVAVATGDAPLVDVVINPGLGFGTGLHPTTRGTLQLLQDAAAPEGPLVDSGTGSGILAIAAAKLGWRPVIAFDSDPVALLSARDNVETNGVVGLVRVHEVEVATAPLSWFADATVLANMTLEPVLSLVRRLAGDAEPQTGAAMVGRPRRLVVSGILAGVQEQELLSEAARYGFSPGRRLYEAEWVSMELLPSAPGAGAPGGGGPADGASAGTGF